MVKIAGPALDIPSSAPAGTPAAGFNRLGSNPDRPGRLLVRNSSGDLVPVSLGWEGVWSDATAYVIGDLVEHLGSTYVALQASTDEAPDTVDSDYWEMLASKGDTGVTGDTGPQGPAGGAITARYTYDDTTTDSNPGAGLFRFDAPSVAQDAATIIRLSHTTADADNWSPIIDTFDDSTSTHKGHIRIQSIATGEWLTFRISSIATGSGGAYRNITAAVIGYSSSEAILDGEACYVYFTAKGDKGDQGDQGDQGTAGINGTAGGPKVQLNFTETTDLHSGTSLTIDTWNTLKTTSSFTVDDASSLLEVSVRGSVRIDTPISNVCEVMTRVKVDSTVVALLGGAGASTGASLTGMANPLSGAEPFYVSGISAGSHTITVEVYINRSGGAMYCRCSSVPNIESLGIQVIEHKAGGLSWVPKGTYSAGTAYAVNEVVSYSGSSYIAIQAGTGQTPSSSPTYWTLIASKGDTGATGTDASPPPVAIEYEFDTTTTDSDPGSGKLRLGSAPQNFATVIRADDFDVNGQTWSAVLPTLDDSTDTVKGYIRLSKKNAPQNFILFSVSAVGSESGYKNITVTPVNSSSSTPFANTDRVWLTFQRNGNQGNPAGTGNALSIDYTFSTTTTDSDPGSGVLRLSSGTQNGSTVIRADLNDAAGNSASSPLGNMVESLSPTHKGYLRISSKATPANFILWSVTGLASPSGYKNITGIVIISSGSNPFTNGETVTMTFTREGSMPAAYLDLQRAAASAGVSPSSTPGSGYDRYQIDEAGRLWVTNPSGITVPTMYQPNGIRNAGFKVNQRQVTSVAAAAGLQYLVDRWALSSAGSNLYAAYMSADQPTLAQLGKLNVGCITLQRGAGTAANAAGTIDSIMFSLEGYDYAKYHAQTHCVSWWSRASKTGACAFSVVNAAADRSFTFLYNHTATDTWQWFYAVIPPVSGGTWNLASGLAVRYRWSALVGSTFAVGTNGAWTNNAALGPSTGLANNLTAASDYMQVTGVQMNEGPVPTPFVFDDFDVELAAAMRYWQKNINYGGSMLTGGLAKGYTVEGASIAAGQFYVTWDFAVPMRTSPAVVIRPYTSPGSNTAMSSNGGGTNFAANSAVMQSGNEKGISIVNNSGGALTMSSNQLVFLAIQADAEI